MTEVLKLIPVALRDFALPVPRAGSIEAYSGYGRAAEEGREIHVRVQKKRAKSDPSYESEVRVSRSFDREGYRFRIDGRMDGIFRREPPLIEEIKTGFNVRELGRLLSENPLAHPYGLQLATYGYFHWLEHKVVPELFFHLVSTRGSDSLDLEQPFDLRAYEKWLELRLDELVLEARKAEKRAARRRKIAAEFSFPFATPRPGQVELMHAVEQGMSEGRPMLIQAPTGMGKTAGVLYPVLKDALSRGRMVVYVTPKNSQHSVAEDAVTRFQEGGAKLKSLTITAKGKICFKNEPLCDPGFCEYAGDYYAKIANSGLLDVLAKKKKLKARTFRELGETYEVCPFELQIDAAPEADVIICDYNYVFAPRSSLGRMAAMDVDQEGKPNLVIDEAHNLPSRAMDYYSPAVSTVTLEQMRGEVRALPARFRSESEELLDSCIRVIASCMPEESTRPAKIDPPVDSFLEQDAKLRAFLSRYLDCDIEIERRDAVLRLFFYWSAFAEALEYAADPSRPEFFTTFQPHAGGGMVKITCCDASAMLRDCYNGYEHAVGFSATLKPFDFYAKLSGLDPSEVKTAEFPSPFPKEHRKILVIPQISTKYSDRDRNYAKIADAIQRIVSLRRGNYFAFFPSFEFLERVLALFDPPAGFTIIRQDRDMKTSRVEAVLEHLREGSSPAILFAVQGGTFSEGVDYPGEMAIGAFVVGPPLPNFDFEREQMREYYQKQYGAGFDYAYAIPAMSRAVQAAGRVIRSETDRGLIVLMDNRFVQPIYSRSMPADWFESDVRELVSESILKDVAEFWGKSPV
ncbi:MAG: ATP-dependent DNA helicase [Nitrospirota bacterium]